jgi:hypothetical protein
LESKEAVKIWHEGTIGIPTGDTYTVAHYWVKAYDEPSDDYGIYGGRISKLSIKINGKFTANYDRGWDMEPAKDDEATQLVYCILLQNYN